MYIRPHNRKAIQTTVSALRQKARALVVMATGVGKTVVAAHTYKCLRRGSSRMRNLVLCHDGEILKQSVETFRKALGPKVSIGYFTSEQKDPHAKALFATFQTMRGWKKAFAPNEFGLVTVDECHHSQAPTYKKVADYFSEAAMLGLTATKDRMDGKKIEDIFGEPVVDLPLEEAIVKRLLTPFEYRVVSDGLTSKAVRHLTRAIQGGKRFTLADVNKRLFIDARDESIVRRIKLRARGRKTLVFCRNIKHAERIAEMLGRSARGYHTGETKKISAVNLTAFRAGLIQYLVTVNKANEGVDIPDAEVVVFLRVTESKTILFQQLGRSLRKIRGKKKSLVLDFVGNLERVAMLQDLVRKVTRLKGRKKYLRRQFTSIKGANFQFDFSEAAYELLRVITLLKRDFYLTCQEAERATRKLNIDKTNIQRSYKEKYRLDPRLPSNPNTYYKDFPGWRVFVGEKPRTTPYRSWRKAGRQAVVLGATSVQRYAKVYREDPQLPGDPRHYYKDFPGWDVFLGKRPKNRYPTCFAASKAARRLGITTKTQYEAKYKKDPRLPGQPRTFYKDFPGWRAFVGGRSRLGYYPTWQKAGSGAKRLKIKTGREYEKKYKKDPRLPAAPWRWYKDFPGWPKFLGRKRARRK